MRMEITNTGKKRTADDGCRRYRAVNLSFDFRARSLTFPIPDDEGKEWRLETQRGIRDGLMFEYGIDHHEQKIKNFIEVDIAPCSVLSVHNELLAQVRGAFIGRAYYPALVGAGALGERLLNEIFLTLRKYFISHPATKDVRNNKSIDNWMKLIRILREWDAISETVAIGFQELLSIRNPTVHYGIPDLHVTGGRAEALKAILILQKIIAQLFPAMEPSDFFIQHPQGFPYLKRESEELPFVKEFLIPSCVLVSPQNEYRDFATENMTVLDNAEFNQDFGIDELSDVDFIKWANPVVVDNEDSAPETDAETEADQEVKEKSA